jgi:hypothetical protein
MENGKTYAEAQRIAFAILKGLSSGATGGAGTQRFMSDDGSKPRVTGTLDQYGNRTSVIVDGT